MKITKMATALIVEVIGIIATVITGYILIMAHPVKTILVLVGVTTIVIGEIMRRHNLT